MGKAWLFNKMPHLFKSTDTPDMNVHLTIAAMLVLFFSMALVHV